jgi:hypothetical protein
MAHNSALFMSKYIKSMQLNNQKPVNVNNIRLGSDLGYKNYSKDQSK